MPHASALMMNDDEDQHHAEADGQRQVALGGFQRDRRRHRAGEAVDVAADDDDGADFRGRTAESGEQCGDELKRASQISVATRRSRPDVHCREFVLIFDPQVFDRLTRRARR